MWRRVFISALVFGSGPAKQDWARVSAYIGNGTLFIYVNDEVGFDPVVRFHGWVWLGGEDVCSWNWVVRDGKLIPVIWQGDDGDVVVPMFGGLFYRDFVDSTVVDNFSDVEGVVLGALRGAVNGDL